MKVVVVSWVEGFVMVVVTVGQMGRNTVVRRSCIVRHGHNFEIRSQK